MHGYGFTSVHGLCWVVYHKVLWPAGCFITVFFVGCCLSQGLIHGGLVITVKLESVADLGGVRGVQMHPPLVASNVFCVHNCTSPSNDYAAVACSNNNQAQLHTHVSVPY